MLQTVPALCLPICLSGQSPGICREPGSDANPYLIISNTASFAGLTITCLASWGTETGSCVWCPACFDP